MKGGDTYGKEGQKARREAEQKALITL